MLSKKESVGIHRANQSIHYARRVGWYAVIRVLKPKVVVETGIHAGIGSCVICAALQKNEEEGFAGKYYGLDINPQAGYLLQPPYSEFGELIYASSDETLKSFGRQIDILINDSDHSADYEAMEYEIAKEYLSESSVILGDNSHCTDKLFKFAVANGMKYLFYSEKPKDHWYPGAGIGCAYFDHSQKHDDQCLPMSRELVDE